METAIGDGPLTLAPDGAVPETRLRNAESVISWAKRLQDNDDKRAWKRSRVDGLVNGNPPYSQKSLKNANRADACNVNWGSGRTYLESGSGAFYDLTNEAPGMFIIRTSYGVDQAKRDEYSRIMSAEADMVLAEDDSWDFEVQQSQDQMTLHGRGPLLFEDTMAVLPVSVHDADLRVPERTRADTKYWDGCTLDRDYYPPDLYKFIRDPAAAKSVGWDVEHTRKAIITAMDIKQEPGQVQTWEFYQQELANNSTTYMEDAKVCKLAHVFVREFDGMITHAIIERDYTGTSEAKYLFFHRGRYRNFKECVHPFYFDRGNGGFHHSVRGLGIKMYDAMEYENRLRCNLMDKAFAPKTLFRPTSVEATQKMQLTRYGDYAVLPAGWEAMQNPIQGFLQDGMAMLKESSEVMRSNLSSYRQQVPMQESGNPATAFQKKLEASQASSLSKTTFNRYYKQLDLLYTEIARRMFNINSTDARAKRCQERCANKGVPRECFGRIESTEAHRVIGEGNSLLRRSALTELASVVGRYPEDGQSNWLNDYTAAVAGQKAVSRYNPVRQRKELQDDQAVEASLQIAGMKVGMPPVISPSQNALKFAAMFLAAGVQAIQSLKQGGDPAQVLAFVNLAGPAAMAHLRRIANDPFRQQAAKAIAGQLKQLLVIAGKLKEHLKAQQQQQQQLQQKAQQIRSDADVKRLKVTGDLQLKAAKQKATLAMAAQKHRQSLAISDGMAASTIHRQNRLAAFNP